MFKVRHVTCDDEVLAIRQEMEDKKNEERVGAILKHIDTFNDRLEKYEYLFEQNSNKSKNSATALKIWCNVRRKKTDGAIPVRAKMVREYAQKLEGREVLSVREYLLDQGYAEALVDNVLNAPENALSVANEDDGDDEDEEAWEEGEL